MNDILLSNMIRSARSLFCVVLVLLSGSLLAEARDWQAGGVTGIVKDESGAAIPGVTIVLKGTSTGTVTDMDGKYSVNAGEGAVLVFSSIGYVAQEIEVGGRTAIDITLAENVSTLDEIVVVGYGVQEAKDVTGSVTKVESEAIERMPATSFEQALKGRAAGVQVSQSAGDPGGKTQIRIRGGNSMIGNNDPLFVVDGFPITGGIDYLNPSDILSIDILKDASGTAIYGARGANGVVIVTTRRGSQNKKGEINIHSYYGVQNEINRVEVLNAEQYAIMANDYLKNQGLAPFFQIDGNAGTVTDGLGNVSTLEGTKWQDVAVKPASIQKHSISFSGGNQKTAYALSFNYLDQQGIVHNSGLKRGNLRLNLDNEVNDRLKLAASLNFNRDEIRAVDVNNRDIHEILGMSPPPTLPVYDANGLPTRIKTAYFFGSEDMEHPNYIGAPFTDRTIKTSILSNVSLDYKIAKGLTFKVLMGLEYQPSFRDYFIPKIYVGDRGTASQTSSSSNSFLNENTLSYTKTFREKHKIDAVGGFTYQTFQGRSLSSSVLGLANNVTTSHNLGSASVISPPVDAISEWKLLSGLARVNYSYDSRYMVTVSMRVDGSSRFGKDNKWGTFPSAALAWRLSEEPFMKALSFISDLKVRTSYGVTGNTGLNPYQSLSRMGSFRTVYGNNSDYVGFAPLNIENPSLKWETTAQTDAGFDVSFLDGVVGFSFDYYRKVTSNLLASVPLPTSSGFGSVLRNIGEIENKGFEIAAYASILRGTLKWDISGQYSRNRNEVLSLAGGSDILSSGLGNPFGSAGINIARVGEPFGSFFGFREEGVIPETGQRNIIDVDGDGTITAADRVILGSPYPKFMAGLTNNFKYKKFSLSIFMEGVYGNDVYWAAGAAHQNSFQRGHNQLADFAGNYWTETNRNAKYPKPSSQTFVQASDAFLHDASYLRMKNVTFSYDIAPKAWFGGGQIYVSTMNLFTITNYPGVDPEVNTLATESPNVGDRLRIGIAGTAYPTAKTFILGLKLKL
ncbi:MAG TPA: TonB-dependent receptor [Cyclobacteriaceae bacterium]|nr:TonB-dependent receptor [Cyclobacteriaceae bacterium]